MKLAKRKKQKMKPTKGMHGSLMMVAFFNLVSKRFDISIRAYKKVGPKTYVNRKF